MAEITQTISTVTILPTPPNPNNPATFDDLAYPYTVAQNAFGVDVNDMATELNNFATQTNAVRDEVVQAKDAILTNYKGVWNSGTTYLVGQSVSYGGFYWISNVNSNINNTPIEGANWSKTGTVGGSYLSLSGGNMTGAITALKETSVAMTANDINLNLGNLFTKTITGATTITVSNVPASGQAVVFVLKLTNGGAGAVTYPTGTKWSKGTAPTLTASGVDLLRFITEDGGTNWYASRINEDAK